MSPLPTALPYGLRDVKLKAEGTTTQVDLPNSRTFSFSEAENFTELRGDDTVVAIRGTGPSVNWDLEAGGISLEAYAILVGGTVTESGVTPNIKKTYKKLVTQSRPYFRVEGQAISDSGGDFHVVLYRCKAEGDIEGELTDGEFWLTSGSGRAVKDLASDVLYDFIQNETATAIV